MSIPQAGAGGGVGWSVGVQECTVGAMLGGVGLRRGPKYRAAIFPTSLRQREDKSLENSHLLLENRLQRGRKVEKSHGVAREA